MSATEVVIARRKRLPGFAAALFVFVGDRLPFGALLADHRGEK
jgi:hypothetical protein